MTTTQSILGTLAGLLIGGLITLAASQGSVEAFGLPLFAICAMCAFAIQWIVFVHAYTFKTEQYFDLTGGLTYLAVIALALLMIESLNGRTLLIAVLVSIWATRLGGFLFQRIKRAGGDRRFDKMKTIPSQVFMTWTLQGLWVVVTLCAGLAAMTSSSQVPLGLWGYVGFGLWVAGFGLEVTADRQKSRFREENKTGFITSGVWSWSRHPNYFGEILLWIGIALIALPTMEGWRYITLISPVYVCIQLTLISGVRMLEKSAEQRWGQEEEYQAYVKRTSSLIPFPPG